MAYYHKEDADKLLSEINNKDIKPVILEGRAKPYEKLDDREFEVLSYYLFKTNKVGENKEYDSIDLMKGVGENGRDCILYRNGQVAGIIQSKHTEKETRMNRPAATREIIKFALNCIKYNDLIPKEGEIDYYLVHSFGFSEPAQKLLSNFYNEVTKNEEELEKITNKVIKNYKTLSELKYDSIHDELLGILKRLNVIKYEKQDLDLLMANQNEILSIFFEVQKVVIKEPSLSRKYESINPSNAQIKTIYNTKTFISKLKEIGIDIPNIINAIKDYWSALMTLNLMYDTEFFAEDEIEAYQRDLVLKYSNKYNKDCEDINQDDTSKIIKSKSRKFYWDVMNQNPLKIIGLSDNRPFFQNGMYQDLANGSDIETWMLKYVGKEIDYEDIDNFI